MAGKIGCFLQNLEMWNIYKDSPDFLL